MRKLYRPKGYYLQDGCWNCVHVDRDAVASGLYPVCKAYSQYFFATNYGKCKRYTKDADSYCSENKPEDRLKAIKIIDKIIEADKRRFDEFGK